MSTLRRSVLIAAALIASSAFGEQPSTTTVLIAGSGTEPYVQTLLDDVTDFLKLQGIKVKLATDPAKPRNFQLEHLAETGAQSLVYVTLSLVKGEIHDQFAVECFDVSGKKLWREEVGSGAAFSYSSAVKKMAKSMRKKLEVHVGQPGLPK